MRQVLGEKQFVRTERENAVSRDLVTANQIFGGQWDVGGATPINTGEKMVAYSLSFAAAEETERPLPNFLQFYWIYYF